MGLTIHYSLKLKDTSNTDNIVHQMRQIALDLPFEDVDEIKTYENCVDNGTDSERWLLIQSRRSLRLPWNKRYSIDIIPQKVVAFSTWPGPGSESANFGICLYPQEVEHEYDVRHDERFQSLHKDGLFDEFDWKKYNSFRHSKRKKPPVVPFLRVLPTRIKGGHWSSFCKTQYASNPECGGIPNFLRCHITVITFLDRIAKIPGLKVEIKDEGKYGSSCYSDDYEEAYKAGIEPTYKMHKGHYSPSALASEVGEWNTMIAAMVGALSDTFGQGEAPIKDFPNFEHLEFKGQNQKYIEPFLKAMRGFSKNEAQ